MSKSKKQQEPAAKPGTVIQNCHFTNNSQANEHTWAAIEALANAAAENARALQAMAKALDGFGVNQTALRIDSGD
jgi:hypothetical protein